MISVNPPPQIKLPDALAKDKATVTYFRHLDRMLLQLWKRTGGGSDYIDDIVSDVNPIMDLSAINNKIDDLSEGQSPLVDLSIINERLDDLESSAIMTVSEQVEAGGGVSKVTQYTGAMSGTTTNVTITAVDRAKSYLLLTTAASNTSGTARTIQCKATFTTDTNVALTRGDQSQGTNYTLQVIEN